MTEQRNWLELPDDVTANILKRVGVFEILENVQYVCTAWLRVCNDPAMWRVIDMENLGHLVAERVHVCVCTLLDMCMHAIELSQGQLVHLNVELFANIELIEFLAQGERSSQLKRLQITNWNGSFCESWSDFLKKAPLLEEIVFTSVPLIEKMVPAIGGYCPLLKSFTYNCYGMRHFKSGDEFVIAVAKGMPQLLHLQLIGSEMTYKGLQAILDGCPNLQSLDLRGCFNIELDENREKLCREQIKDLRLPRDSMEGHKVGP